MKRGRSKHRLRGGQRAVAPEIRPVTSGIDPDRVAPWARRNGRGQRLTDVNHFGGKTTLETAKMVQTEREQAGRSCYVRDVGQASLLPGQMSDAFEKSMTWLSTQKAVYASPIVQHILLIILIALCSTLSVSALVSAMQGFDTLVHS